MKQKSKLKDLIEDIVDSDLLALDESEYQSQEESSDNDEDDLEESEEEEDDEVEEAKKHDSDEDEIEESEDEDEEDESTKNESEESDESEEEEDDEVEEAKKHDSDEDEIEESEDEEEEEVDEQFENIKVDLTNVSNLIESEAGLTEEFKSKAAIIFEAEVKSQLKNIKSNIEKKYSRRLDEAVSTIEETLTEQVDGYLTYAVQQWMKENQVAIESSLRTEIAENFMTSLKSLFTESYVEVPASKVDLFAKLEEEKQEVESKLSKSLELLGGLVEKVEDMSREKAIEESCSDLTQTQALRLKKLAESVEFVNEDSFKDKVQTLKEFYFKGDSKSKKTKTLTEDTSMFEDSEVETIVEGEIKSVTKIDPEMSIYLKALNAMNKSVTH